MLSLGMEGHDRRSEGQGRARWAQAGQRCAVKDESAEGLLLGHRPRLLFPLVDLHLLGQGGHLPIEAGTDPCLHFP